MPDVVGGVYKIGATVGGLAFLTALATPCNDPRGDSQDYSAPTRNGTGAISNLGWLQQTWHWDFMTEAQWTMIKSFVGTCAIHTRANSGTMTTYNAVMLNMENEPEHFNNKVLDVTVTFIKLTVP